MEINSAQANAVLHSLGRQVFILRAEVRAISAALATAGIVKPEHLEAAALEAANQYQSVLEKMKSFHSASSMDANESTVDYVEFIENAR